MVERAGWTGFTAGVIVTLAIVVFLLIASVVEAGSRGVTIHKTPCAEDEVLVPARYEPQANSRYVCRHRDSL